MEATGLLFSWSKPSDVSGVRATYLPLSRSALWPFVLASYKGCDRLSCPWESVFDLERHDCTVRAFLSMLTFCPLLETFFVVGDGTIVTLEKTASRLSLRGYRKLHHPVVDYDHHANFILLPDDLVVRGYHTSFFFTFPRKGYIRLLSLLRSLSSFNHLA